MRIKHRTFTKTDQEIVDKQFEAAVSNVFIHEGGYVDHPSDPGGATNYGISLRFYRKVISKDATKEVIQSLSKDDARRIYYDHFWIGFRYEDLSIDISVKVFDMAVNMGHSQAARIFQRAINSLCKNTFSQVLNVDGVIGNQTVRVSNSLNQVALLECIRYEQEMYYRRLADGNAKYEVFLKGWLRRAMG